MCSAVDDHILADNVIIAEDTFRLLTHEVEVLGQCSNHSTLMHLVTFSHARTIQNTHEGENDAIITDNDIVLNIDEGEYLTVVADFRLRRYFSAWRNFTCHNCQFSIINLLRTTAQSLIQVHNGLHLVEIVGDLRNLGIQQIRLSRNHLQIGNVGR